MSAAVRTPECYPEFGFLAWAFPNLTIPAPNHEACPVGHHLPGLIGGWHCSCPCHRESRQQ